MWVKIDNISKIEKGKKVRRHSYVNENGEDVYSKENIIIEVHSHFVKFNNHNLTPISLLLTDYEIFIE